MTHTKYNAPPKSSPVNTREARRARMKAAAEQALGLDMVQVGNRVYADSLRLALSMALPSSSFPAFVRAARFTRTAQTAPSYIASARGRRVPLYRVTRKTIKALQEMAEA